MKGWLHRLEATVPLLAEANRARKVATMQLRDVARELRYPPGSNLRDELVDLKRFIRRAFQLLAYNGIDGDYAEFGCYGARTFTLASGASRLVDHPAHLWAFDSFAGLPASDDPRDAHPGWEQGVMAMSELDFVARCVAAGVPESSFSTVAGFYADTLPGPAGAPRPERVAFAYLDCDLYTSTRQALDFLLGRLVHGAVVAFDDYYCFSPTQTSGERLAAAEVFGAQDRWRLVPYIQWGWYGMSFVVEDAALAPAPLPGR